MKQIFKKTSATLIWAILIVSGLVFSQEKEIRYKNKTYPLYPKVLDVKPDIPSPYISHEGNELIVAYTQHNKYAIIDISLTKEKQLTMDEKDFPHYAKNGLHLESELEQTKTITGRLVSEITDLGRPGGLSQDGFMTAREDIISVLKGDNKIVKKLGLTHPQMAKPLLYILNLMDIEMALKTWWGNSGQWKNISYFLFNDKKILIKDAILTKGTQLSIFEDDVEGYAHIKITRELDQNEKDFLNKKYSFLNEKQMMDMIDRISFMNSAEMQPYYIQRYGFYEGHTFWRTDPLAIAFIFGLKSIEEIEEFFPGRLYEVLTTEHTR